MSENPKILVIDDEEIVHASIKRILSRIGHEVDAALTAAEGLKMLERGGYDAVITDLMMPEMNGVEMLKAMNERGIKIPAIMITGYPTIKTAIQALRLGAVDYIPKPFTRQELLSPLSRALRRSVESLESGAEPEPGDDDKESRQPVKPGDCFYLPEHSWALYNEDGTLDVGVENGFLKSIPEVTAIEAPLENDLVEQGYPGIKLKAGAEVHSVFMPLSGRVLVVNEIVLATPRLLESRAWVVKILPASLGEEIVSLRRRQKC